MPARFGFRFWAYGSKLVGGWALAAADNQRRAGRPQAADLASPQELILAADGRAQFLVKGSVTATTTYTITQGVSLLSQKPVTILSFSGTSSFPAPQKQVIASVTAEDLDLSDDAFDGFGYHYRRQ